MGNQLQLPVPLLQQVYDEAVLSYGPESDFPWYLVEDLLALHSGLPVRMPKEDCVIINRVLVRNRYGPVFIDGTEPFIGK